ncbi:MAG: hypothetical protein AAB019_06305 [Planctomycetota bacterium]
MTKDSENVSLREINRKLDQIMAFISGLKGSAPALSATRAPKFPLHPDATFKDIIARNNNAHYGIIYSRAA